MSATPLEKFAQALYAATGERIHENGNGRQARCPAHEDSNPSLSVSVGNDGRLLLHCHAGCSCAAIFSAIGLRPADLFAEKLRTSTPTKPAGGGDSRRFRRHDETDKPKFFPSSDAAIAALTRKLGPPSASWTYHAADGTPVGIILRWDQPDGSKFIRPVSLTPGGWIIGGMPEPRPLYCLPELLGTSRVYVAEGEKAADALRSIGLVATTSPHGSKSAGKAEWSPLAGRDVVILPDNDAPGRTYAETVAAILSRLTPPATVRIVDLPDLPEGGDAVEFLAARGEVPAESIHQEIAGLIESVGPADPRVESTLETFQPFPVDAFPEPVRGIIRTASTSIGCDASFVALPMLAAVTASIGNSRRVLLKSGWTEPAIVWVATIGDSGTQKTPAFRFAMTPLRTLQGRMLDAYEVASQQYDAELASYDKALAEWKRDKKAGGPPPTKPESPTAERVSVSDTTVEALAPLLRENPRGLLLARDELSGWVGSFDRYASKGKGGADAANWLSMHVGESITVDRKTGQPRTIYVPMAAVSVAGGIQPGILKRVMHSEHRESGLAARLLFAWPPRRTKRWSETGTPKTIERAYSDLIDALLALTPAIDEDGKPTPTCLPLTKAAKSRWKSFYNAHADEQADLEGDESAAWSKLEAYAARFALIIHCIRQVSDDPTLESRDKVDAESVEAAVRLVRWFGREARRVYAMLREDDDQRGRRRLLEWIDGHGGTVSPRDLQRGLRRFSTAGAAEDALEDLAKAGLGHWEPAPPSAAGGRPTRRFISANRADKTPTAEAESHDSVDVGSDEAPEVDADDWGEV